MWRKTFFLQVFAFKTFFLELSIQTIAADVHLDPCPETVCQFTDLVARLN